MILANFSKFIQQHFYYLIFFIPRKLLFQKLIKPNLNAYWLITFINCP
jgi:hypothetical protein